MNEGGRGLAGNRWRLLWKLVLRAMRLRENQTERPLGSPRRSPRREPGKGSCVRAQRPPIGAKVKFCRHGRPSRKWPAAKGGQQSSLLPEILDARRAAQARVRSSARRAHAEAGICALAARRAANHLWFDGTRHGAAGGAGRSAGEWPPAVKSSHVRRSSPATISAITAVRSRTARERQTGRALETAALDRIPMPRPSDWCSG